MTHGTTHPIADAATSIEVVLPGLVEPDGLEVRARPVPQPGAGQVLIELAATGISFAEQAMRRGRYPGQPAFPFVPGYDVVGTVRAVGPEVTESLVGTQVAAVTKTGSWATYSIVRAADLVSVPAGLDPSEVETVIVNGVTAWQMLHRKAHVTSRPDDPGARRQRRRRHDPGPARPACGRSGDRHRGSPASRRPARPRGRTGRLCRPRPGRTGSASSRPTAWTPPSTISAWRARGGRYGLLARGGHSACSYGTAAELKDAGSVVSIFISLVGQLTWWNVLPNSHRASFYNFWARTPDPSDRVPASPPAGPDLRAGVAG